MLPVWLLDARWVDCDPYGLYGTPFMMYPDGSEVRFVLRAADTQVCDASMELWGAMSGPKKQKKSLLFFASDNISRYYLM